MTKPLILIIGDNEDNLNLTLNLEACGRFKCTQVKSCDKAQPHLASSPAVVLFCFSHYKQDVFDFLEKNALLEKDDTKVIFLSSGVINQNIEECMSSGAIFHFRQPISIDRLNSVINEVANEYINPNNIKGKTSSNIDQFGLLCGNSDQMLEVFKQINKVSNSDLSVLLIGESGTGKELAAQTIYSLCPNSKGAFIALNCSAIPKDLIESELFGHKKGSFTGAKDNHVGYIERANNGTLFLDEITEMPIELQAKLLRVLETQSFYPLGDDKERHVNLRIISATNRDPNQAIRENQIREDLYFRLAQFTIYLPTLCDRKEDIIPLAEHFLAKRIDKTRQIKTLSGDAKSLLKTYHWPGNVRELKHQIEQAYILAEDIIKPKDFPNIINQKPSNDNEIDILMGSSIEDVESALIKKTLNKHNNRKKTAEILGISEKTLYNKIQKYNISND